MIPTPWKVWISFTTCLSQVQNIKISKSEKLPYPDDVVSVISWSDKTNVGTITKYKEVNVSRRQNKPFLPFISTMLLISLIFFGRTVLKKIVPNEYVHINKRWVWRDPLKFYSCISPYHPLFIAFLLTKFRKSWNL